MTTQDLTPEVEVNYYPAVDWGPLATIEITLGGYGFSTEISRTKQNGCRGWGYHHGAQLHEKLEDAVAAVVALITKNFNAAELVPVTELNFSAGPTGWRALTQLPEYAEFYITTETEFDRTELLKLRGYEVRVTRPHQRTGERVGTSVVAPEEAMQFANTFYAQRVREHNSQKMLTKEKNYERNL